MNTQSQQRKGRQPRWAVRTAAFFTLCTGHLWASSPTLERVRQAPQLQALPIAISGRADTVPGSGSPTDLGSKDYRAQWPGTIFTAAFRGSTVYLRIGANHEILHVKVDGGELTSLSKPEPGIYRVSALDNTRHVIQVLVATESQDAPNVFGGFGIPGDERPLPPPTKPARQIEFIGDSHTVGYGNTSPKNRCTPDEVWSTTDDTQAFGALTAMHYGAEYQVNAISGRGIVRNYNGIAAPTLPQAYPYVLFDQKTAVHDPTWRPQVLVIALGTNDFSTALNPGEPWKSRDALHADYEAKYVRFLEELHRADPGAYMILWATEMAKGEIESEVGKVAAQARAQGITRLAYLPIDHLEFSGCDGHPSLADDRAIRDRLVQVIDAQPNIWQGK